MRLFCHTEGLGKSLFLTRRLELKLKLTLDCCYKTVSETSCLINYLTLQVYNILQIPLTKIISSEVSSLLVFVGYVIMYSQTVKHPFKLNQRPSIQIDCHADSYVIRTG